MKQIYIVTSNYNSFFGNVVRVVKQGYWNHAGIALNKELNPMYTYGRRYNKDIHKFGGFRTETLDNIADDKEDLTIKVIEVNIEDKHYNYLETRMEYLQDKMKHTNYNFSDLFFSAFNIRVSDSYNMDNKQVCSIFVADILNTIKHPIKTDTDKSLNLITPDDLANAPEFDKSMKVIYEGPAKGYIPAIIKEDLAVLEGDVENPRYTGPSHTPDGCPYIKLLKNEKSYGVDQFLTVMDNIGNDVYIITDMHIGDDSIDRSPNIVLKQGDLWKHVADDIIKTINSKVSHYGHILCLGDIAGHHDNVTVDMIKYFIDGLRCKNFYLILGNNDYFPIEEYKKMGIKMVADVVEWRNIIFSHIPVKIVPSGCINIHGHLHNVNVYMGTNQDGHYKVWNPNFTPIKLGDIPYQQYVMESKVLGGDGIDDDTADKILSKLKPICKKYSKGVEQYNPRLWREVSNNKRLVFDLTDMAPQEKIINNYHHIKDIAYDLGKETVDLKTIKSIGYGDGDEGCIYVKMKPSMTEWFLNITESVSPSLISLNHLKKERINPYLLKSLEEQYPSMSYIICDNTSKGYMYFDDQGQPIAIINVVDNGGGVFQIQNITVAPIYKNSKLEDQLLDVAVHELHANKAFVSKRNEDTVDLYKKKGFKISGDSHVSYTMIRESISMEKSYQLFNGFITHIDKCDISYSNSFSDVKTVVDTLSNKDLNRICNGEFKESPYVIYREVLLINKQPVSFVEVYKLPGMKEDGVIVVACDPKWRSMGLSSSLISRMKSKLKGKNLVWKTQKDNEDSIYLAKKMKFQPIVESFVVETLDDSNDKNMIFMTTDKSVLESFSRDDINSEFLEKGDSCYNLDKLDPNGYNILWITGIAGSGKTTLGQDLAKKNNWYRIEMDFIVCYYLKRSLDGNRYEKVRKKVYDECPEAVEFFDVVPADNYGYPEKYRYSDVIYYDFFKWFIPKVQGNGNIYIINGAGIPNLYEPKFFYDKPLILKETNYFKTSLRRLLREFRCEDSSFIQKTEWAFKTLKSNMDLGYRQANRDFVNYYKDLNDNALLVESKEIKRSEMPDEMFGVPEERKYQLDTKKHVLSAIKLFNWVEPKYEKELAKNINNKIQEFNISDDEIHITEKNRFYKYYKKG